MLRKLLRNFGRIRRNEKQAQKCNMAAANDVAGNSIFYLLMFVADSATFMYLITQ